MAKDTKNIKSSMTGHRNKQAVQRSKELELNQERNEDILNDVYAGLYSKGMTHDASTMICEESRIKELQLALESGRQSDFDDLDKAGARKQVSPQAALGFEFSGADPEGIEMRKCDSLSGRETASEMAEVYGKALLRNKPFSEYENGDQDVQDVIDALNAFGDDFKGPKENGLVTAKTLFRGVAPGCTVGSYVSQLLMHPIGVGNYTIEQKGPTKIGTYGITKANYLQIQNGNVPVSQQIDTTMKHMYNGAQIGSTVHIDLVFQHFYEASAILLNAGVGRNAGFPTLDKEAAFISMGGPVEITTGVAEIARHALKAAWVQKWRKHLRLRPEACAARVVAELDGLIPDGTVHADLKNSSLVSAISAMNLSNGGESKPFLPLQYAEGSPTHPSFPAGHAAIAGACATLMKIYFADGAWSSTGLSELESVDGLSTSNYAKADAGQITIHGEINKLAADISIGRNIAGVHYRIDGDEGMVLGEKVAIQYFKDMKESQNEDIGEITLIKFDGTEVKL